jgi:ketosteroid isomerase-like protein
MLATSDETRRVVEGYFRAWTCQKIDDAYALLADDLEFIGPSARYQSAATFRPALINFAAMTKSAQISEMIVDGNRAAMVYDCELPFGSLRIASFFRVENGKIRWYETHFDPTELKKLLAR